MRQLQIDPKVLGALVIAALILSAVQPYDYFTWLLEALPVLIGLPMVIATRSRFPLSTLLYWLLMLHALVLLLGAHYTYARVPLGFWLQDWFDFDRNHYDRIGHLFQGFVPAILAREILTRRSPLAGSRWLLVMVFSVCLAFSAFYELIEWWVALAAGISAEAFLGTQGDVWDTQWDMFLAALGALLALLTLSRYHQRQIASL